MGNSFKLSNCIKSYLKPAKYGDDYVGMKNFCSVKVQATCNASECLQALTHSGPVLFIQQSFKKLVGLWGKLQCLQLLLSLVILVGISSWLMTPYENPMTHEEKAYNKLNSKEKVTAERFVGQFKKRFLILEKSFSCGIG